MTLNDLIICEPRIGVIEVPCEVEPGCITQTYMEVKVRSPQVTLSARGSREEAEQLPWALHMRVCPNHFNLFMHTLMMKAKDLAFLGTPKT